MKSNKWILIGCLLLLIAGATVFTCCFNQSRFTGIRIKNPESYFLNFHQMTGSDIHTLELKKGDSLQVHFETSSGSARMMVAAQNGTSIYSGNGTATTDFTLEIPESGTYTVIVEAQHAKGIIDIRLREGRK